MEQATKRKGLFWFRRDLRLNDNTGLYYALKECDSLAPIFIFDKAVLDELPSQDRRVEFIWQCVAALKVQLKELGTDILVRYAYSEQEVVALATKFKVDAVYVNEEYEPACRQRDGIISDELEQIGIEFKSYKDTVIFSQGDIVNGLGKPFTNFSLYKAAWKKNLSSKNYKSNSTFEHFDKFSIFNASDMPTLSEMGFTKTNLEDMRLEPGSWGAQILFDRFKEKILPHYKLLRGIPFAGGVSYLSLHNRYGTISIRYLVNQLITLMKILQDKRRESCEAWLDELIWREFYMQLLYHYPHLAYEPFKSEFNSFPWENNPVYYLAWCEGKTGFPLIDAAMVQLNQTGYMHNSLRMVVSSFLTKHLLTDYHLGEDYFAAKLLDYDLSANNGGWQWAASCGAESQSYVRIFNPVKQSEKIDPEGRFIKKYLPILRNVPAQYLHEPWKYSNELKDFGIEIGNHYPFPIINVEERRKHALSVFEENFRLENAMGI